MKYRNNFIKVRKIRLYYEDFRFLNVFSDNEVRLFFSKFIFFVEGEIELEIFGNFKLVFKFDKLRDIDVYNVNDVYLNVLSLIKNNFFIFFLIFYDFDFLFDINFDSLLCVNLIVFNKKVSLKKIDNLLKCCYYGFKDFIIKKVIREIFFRVEKLKSINDNGIGFKLFKLEYLLNYVNWNVF